MFARESKTYADKQAHEQQLEELYAQIGKLTTQVAWLKKNLVLTHSRAERLAMVERGSGADLRLQEQADLLSMSRASLYYTPRPPSALEVAVKHRIDALIYTRAALFMVRGVILHTLQEEGCGDRAQHGADVYAGDGLGGHLSQAQSQPTGS